MSKSLPEELKPYQFKKKYKWSEACTEQINLRVPKSMKTELQVYGDEYLEFIRQAIEEKLQRESKKG